MGLLYLYSIFIVLPSKKLNYNKISRAYVLLSVKCIHKYIDAIEQLFNVIYKVRYMITNYNHIRVIYNLILLQYNYSYNKCIILTDVFTII